MVITTLIIINYNTYFWLDKCLLSIKNQLANNSIEVIIFDNNSSDESQYFVKKKHPWVKLIKSKNNFGFAEANNRATKAAKGKYLFFLNPDTRLDKDCLKNLFAFAKKVAKKNFILIPKQMVYDGKHFLQLGVASDFLGFPNSAYDKNENKQIRPIFYADGAALFIPKKTFIKLGKFDKGMFMYQEDIDLSWKAHLMNIKLYPVPKATVFHKVGAVAGGGISTNGSYTTTTFRRYHAEKNLLRNLLKNYSWYNLLWILPFNFLINLGEVFLFFLLLKPKISLIYATI